MVNDDITLNQLVHLMKSEGTLAAPSVEQIEPVVRTGLCFMFRDPMKQGVPPAQQKILQDGISSGWLIGTFVVEWGYDVPKDRAMAFPQWLLANEKKIYAAQPEGVHYKGTYAVFSTSDKGMGEYRTVWAYDSFEAMQVFAAELSNQRSKFGGLVREMIDFRDADRAAGRSQQIYLAAAGAKRVC